MFIHQVFFWMNADAPADAAARMIDYLLKNVPNVPSVKHVWAGRPAMTPRTVVDNSYQVGLCVVFDDAAGHDVYQPHPLHLGFMEQFKMYWKTVKVFDYH